VAAGTLAATGLVLSAGSANAAGADANIYASYPVNGSTEIAATNSTMTLGPGTLAATLGVTSGAITANLTLPNATGTFTEFGIVPVTATTEFVQVGDITGQDVNGGVTTTANEIIKLTDLKVAGLDVPVGDRCETETPAVLNLDSGTGFNVLTGGPISGTYTIPKFADCGLLVTPILNLLIPGAGNTIELTLGKPTVSLTPPTS
jgi:hypothetical protein